MKKDVPIEIKIEIVEAGQPRPQRPGPEPSNIKRLRPFRSLQRFASIHRDAENKYSRKSVVSKVKPYPIDPGLRAITQLDKFIR